MVLKKYFYAIPQINSKLHYLQGELQAAYNHQVRHKILYKSV